MLHLFGCVVLMMVLGKDNRIVESGRGEGQDMPCFTKKGPKAKVWFRFWLGLGLGLDLGDVLLGVVVLVGACRRTRARDQRRSIFIGNNLFKEVDHGVR
jgi:hypothetical protein